mgnify:CR=1 FL=1
MVNQISKRILIAEDETLIRLDLAEMLREAGYEVIAEASNGEEAIAQAEEKRPDLAILDVKMPKLDGISAAEKISKICRYFSKLKVSAQPIIFLLPET